MITEEAIKRAAAEHVERHVYYEHNRICALNAFEAGARWMMRQVQMEQLSAKLLKDKRKIGGNAYLFPNRDKD